MARKQKATLFFLKLFLLSLAMLFLSPASGEKVTCEHIDLLWNSNDCCDGSTDEVNCLEYIPKMDLEELIDSLETRIGDLELRLDDLLEGEEIASTTVKEIDMES